MSLKRCDGGAIGPVYIHRMVGLFFCLAGQLERMTGWSVTRGVALACADCTSQASHCPMSHAAPSRRQHIRWAFSARDIEGLRRQISGRRFPYVH